MSIRILEIELSQPVPALPPDLDEQGQPVSGQAKILVRLHRQPLGFLPVAIGPDGLPGPELDALIRQAFNEPIEAHWRHDTALAAPAGACDDYLAIAGCEKPPCQLHEEKLLENAPLITVVVCSHDRPAGAARSVENLLTQRYPNFEIVVVDNAPSTDATRRLIREKFGNNPKVRYVLEERKGLSWARNRGIYAGRGELIAFTDDDIAADPSWLSAFWRNFSLGEHVACVTGLVLPSELETPAQLLCEQYANFNKGFARRVFDNHLSAPGYPYLAGQFGTGGNMAFRRTFLQKLGGFDGRLGAGMPSCAGEDLDIFFRTIKSGATLVYEPGALIWHSHWPDYPTLLNRLGSYGKGLAAYMVNMVHKNPRRLPELLWQAPFGFYYLTSKKSNKNRNRPADFPQELSRAEWRGLLAGPWSYWQSCRVARAYERKFGRSPLSLEAALNQGAFR